MLDILVLLCCFYVTRKRSDHLLLVLRRPLFQVSEFSYAAVELTCLCCQEMLCMFGIFLGCIMISVAYISIFMLHIEQRKLKITLLLSATTNLIFAHAKSVSTP